MNKLVRLVMLLVLCFVGTHLSISTAAPADSPVADASMQGDVETVRLLLADGADVQTARADGLTALHWAAMRSNVELTETLIYAGANLEAVTRLGQHTPLHVASKSGQETVVKALLTAGSSPHALTSSGVTALHLAARAGNAEAVVALLDAGADVNAQESNWGQTPLMFAAASNRLGPVNVLMERGADLETSTRVVDLPAVDVVDRAAAQRRKEVLDGFRVAAPLHEQQGWRPTASQVQAAIRAARTVQAFPQTAERNKEDGSLPTPRAYTERVGTQGGLTALLHAARQGHTETALALLYAGADINHVSGDNTTPLQIATMNGHFDLALRLIERGADPDIATDGGAAPLFAALNLQWAPRARYPQPRAHDQQAVTYLQVMEALLKAGANPNIRLKNHLWYMSYNHCCSESVDGATPFWRAAYATDVEAMQLLMAYGADPHVPTRAPEPRRRNSETAPEPDPSGLPPVVPGGPGVWPLHAASGVGYGEGFESNAHRHVPDGWLPSVKYLVEEVGVDVNTRDHEGYTALHHAAARGDTELVRYFLEHGSDVMAVSRRGQTTADMANGPYQRTLPFPETLALLESLGAVNNDNCVSC